MPCFATIITTIGAISFTRKSHRIKGFKVKDSIMKNSMITTNNWIYRITASPLFIILFATLAFILFVVASVVDTSVPDMIATEAQHRAWVAKYGEPGDQTAYYISIIGAVISAIFAVSAYAVRKWVLANKYWL